MSSNEDSDNETSKHFKKGPKTAYDVQRSKLEKLMKNPEKPVHIPEQKAPKDPNKAPEFVYNVMGSSAGAGSGEFHVYRQIRRKEYMRQKFMNEEKTRDELNEEYHAKLEENERVAEERTAKKRAKRQKKKANQKNKGKKKKTEKPESSPSESDPESDEETDKKEEANDTQSESTKEEKDKE